MYHECSHLLLIKAMLGVELLPGAVALANPEAGVDDVHVVLVLLLVTIGPVLELLAAALSPRQQAPGPRLRDLKQQRHH